MLTLKKTYDHFCQKLLGADVEGAKTAARSIVCSVLQIVEAHFWAYPDQEVSVVDYKRIESKINERLRGRPLAYILQCKQFYGQDFYVDERVLIPRPETELIVDACQKYFSETDQALNILDIGTGSGILALSLARLFPQAKVCAVDISSDALAVCQKNAVKQSLHVECIESNLLQNIEPKRSFDLIVGNLPYVDRADKPSLQKELAYEPDLALFADEHGLALYDSLFQTLAHYMKNKQSKAIFEFGQSQKAPLLHMIEQRPDLKCVQWIKDLAGITRHVVLEKGEV